jgi:hypothetical protein
LISRRYEKTTSAEVSGVPSEKRTFRRRLKVNVLASAETRHDRAIQGLGVVSPPRKVSSVSYMPFTAIWDVGSNIRAGSIVCTTNDVSTTSVPAACALFACGCASAADATRARSASPPTTAVRMRRRGLAALCMWSLLGGGGVEHLFTQTICSSGMT